jgi:hypothetical protein
MLTQHAWLGVLLPPHCAGDTLQPFCPALGAAIMGRHTMSIGSNQNFSIPINVLDAFGSKARRGPGSNWIVALSQSSGDTRQLSGNMRGALSGGYVVLQGLSIQAQPGSKLNLTLSAVPPPGSGDKVRSMQSSLLVVHTSYGALAMRLPCEPHVMVTVAAPCVHACSCWHLKQSCVYSAAVLCFLFCCRSHCPRTSQCWSGRV